MTMGVPGNNSQENNCSRVCNFKEETLAQVLPCKFCEIFENTHFSRTTTIAACWQIWTIATILEGLLNVVG